MPKQSIDDQSDTDKKGELSQNTAKISKKSKAHPKFDNSKIYAKRTWTDDKNKAEDDETELKRGKFEDWEVEMLMNSICDVVKKLDQGQDSLLKLVSEKTSKEFFGIWPQIASVLPNRSVQSCHNLLRRKFNPNNYSGPWSKEDENALVNYIEKWGNEWEKIGGMLGRTGTNCRDKFKYLGGYNYLNRKKSTWSLSETIKLIRSIEKDFGIKFQKNKANRLLKGPEIQEEDLESFKGKNRSKNSSIYEGDQSLRKIERYFNFEVAKTLVSNKVKWSKVLYAVTTKSKDDCRFRWNKQIYDFIMSRNEDNRGEDKQSEDVVLVDTILDQGVDTDKEINWSIIENGRTKSENKYRWEMLKKLVVTRYCDSTDEVIFKLKQHFEQKRQTECDKITKDNLPKEIKLKNNPLYEVSKKHTENTLVNLYKSKYE